MEKSTDHVSYRGAIEEDYVARVRVDAQMTPWGLRALVGRRFPGVKKRGIRASGPAPNHRSMKTTKSHNAD